jgi:hypothetical protein
MQSTSPSCHQLLLLHSKRHLLLSASVHGKKVLETDTHKTLGDKSPLAGKNLIPRNTLVRLH